MNNRQNMQAIMHYQKYDHMPVVSFGFWRETLDKWAEEGHITKEQAENWADNNDTDYQINTLLGFDFNWGGGISCDNFLSPRFKRELLRTLPDGSEVHRQTDGLIVRTKPGVVSIPAHEGTSLTGREAWEELYIPRLTYRPDRVNAEAIKTAYDHLSTIDSPVYLVLGRR